MWISVSQAEVRASPMIQQSRVNPKRTKAKPTLILCTSTILGSGVGGSRKFYRVGDYCSRIISRLEVDSSMQEEGGPGVSL